MHCIAFYFMAFYWIALHCTLLCFFIALHFIAYKVRNMLPQMKMKFVPCTCGIEYVFLTVVKPNPAVISSSLPLLGLADFNCSHCKHTQTDRHIP